MARIRDLIGGIRVAMLTSIDADGSLRSRPMAMLETSFEGEIWFFTNEHSAKVGDVAADRQLNVMLCDPGRERYISISGLGQIVLGHSMMASLWNDHLQRWFQKGLADPDLALLRITVTAVEYWDAPPSLVVGAWGHMRAAVGGESYDDGTHGRVELH